MPQRIFFFDIWFSYKRSYYAVNNIGDEFIGLMKAIIY